MAGDIIPFLYKVTNSDNFNGVNIPEEYETYIDGCHLMTILSEEDKAKRKFINSVTSLNIPTLGPANAKELFEYCYKNNGETDDFFGESTGKLIDNILFLTPEEVYFGIGGGKSGSNAQKAYKKILEDNVNHVEIIKDISLALNFIQKNEPDLIIISDSIDENLCEFCERIRVLTYNMRLIKLRM